jgi:hypothetical protein
VFFLKVNNTGRNISNITANAGLTSSLACNCGGSWSGAKPIGYYSRFNNTNIRISSGDSNYIYGPVPPAMTPEITGIRTAPIITLTF